MSTIASDIRLVDFEELIATFEKIIDEYGQDHVYKPAEPGRCVYKYEGEPDCIVGHVIASISPEDFKILDVNVDQAFNADMLSETILRPDSDDPRNLRALKIRFTPKAAELARQVQTRQDDGWSWGEALANARKAFNV